MRRFNIPTTAVLLCAILCLQTTAHAEDAVAKQTPVPVKDAKVSGKFWTPKLKVYIEDTIPHSWKYVGTSIEELKNAATEEKKPVRNGKWMEANLHKVLESASYALAQHPCKELDAKVDEVVGIVAAGQQPDGFVHGWVINRKIEPWTTLYHQHDGYVIGHLCEAAAAHRRATGKRNYLDVACKAADQACKHFIDNKKPGFPGHAEIELALVELYRVTDNEKYLALAKEFIERRGLHPEQATHYPPAYFQDDLPVRKQKDINGHAVRAIFFATGVADVALETGDKELREAAERLWQSAAKRKMYITGSAGASARHESFGPDYVLPNGGYCESCAACGMANFAHRMLQLDGHADSADEIERIIYNAVLHGIGLDGTTFYYRNPLSDKDHPRGNNWCCCPPTLSRTLLHLGRYAYSHTDDAVCVNLYVGGTCQTELSATPVKLDVATDYPWDGAVKIDVSPEKEAEFAVNLRIPFWCKDATLKVNGQPVAEPRMCKGYAVVKRTWKQGDTIELDMPMPVIRMESHPKVEANTGRVAIQRGPIVYGIEALDNEGTTEVVLPTDPKFTVEHRDDFLGGVTVIKGTTADNKPFTAIPFYALANRDKSQQEVWLVQKDKKDDESGWEGKLYRVYEAGK